MRSAGEGGRGGGGLSVGGRRQKRVPVLDCPETYFGKLVNEVNKAKKTKQGKTLLGIGEIGSGIYTITTRLLDPPPFRLVDLVCLAGPQGHRARPQRPKDPMALGCKGTGI